MSGTPVPVGAAGQKQVHFSLPGFDQHTVRESLPDGSRHPEVRKYLDAVERVHGPIVGFDRRKGPLFHPTTKEFPPAVKAHLLRSLPDDFKPHVRLLKGWARLAEEASGVAHNKIGLKDS